MSRDKLLVLKKFLEENLKKGFIRSSTFLCASLVLFARKPGGGLRFYINYRAFNTITVKNRYFLLLFQKTLFCLNKAQYFTKLDVIAVFNKLRIADEYEYLTAFRIYYGLYELLVVNFGLTNAPVAFQSRINEILRPFLDQFCTVFIDDILIYNDTLEEYYVYVERILTALNKAGLQLNVNKYEFYKTEVKYFRIIVFINSIKIDLEKVITVLK